jgi:hypothetical protein
MATLVLVDARQGSLDRYEIGGSTYRKTHAATLDGEFHFTPKMVEDFRLMPDARFALEPPPRPTNPPAGAGTVRIAA